VIIKNRDVLLSHGNVKGREIALDLIDYAIRAVNGYELTKKIIYVRNGKLIIRDFEYDLSKIRNIYVIGGGKATYPIAKALEEILGERITRGVINVKRGEKRRLKYIRVVEAGHPVPDKAGLEGVREMLEIVEEVDERDLVFCIITGGASALMPYPAEGISLEDLIEVTELLLKSGASIDEINTVRNHIEEIKGGRLAKRIHPAQIVNLIIVDEIPYHPWGPTAPDKTTFRDAIYVLEKYDLWDKVPESVRKHLIRGLNDPNLETLKPRDFENLRVQHVLLAHNTHLCEAAKRRAEELGLNSLILTTKLEGESRDAGIILASIAREIEDYSRPLKPPCVIIVGGETTVTIKGPHGRGGPSQELVLGAALKIAGSEKIVIASVDTDGTDGPTEVAGGIVDGYTIERARELGLDIYKALKTHNSYEVLVKLQDAIITGPTDTNVMDLNVIVVL
jgi:glycerate 2-kinase